MEITKQLPTENVRDYALRVIKDNIVALKLAPGMTVSEKVLAEELGVSRTPVREALLELKKWNLVDIYPQRGCIISRINLQMVEEAVFLRQVLEKAIIEELCSKITDEEISELEHNIELQEFYMSKCEAEKFFALDNEFHYSMYRMCDKEKIYELVRNMLVNFDRVRALSLYTVKDTKVLSDHRALLSALTQRDAELSKQLIGKHLSRYKLEWDEIISKNPDYIDK